MLCMHPTLHDVTAAIVVIGIVVGVVRIVIIVEAEPSPAEGMVETVAMKAPAMETATMETIAGEASAVKGTAAEAAGVECATA